MATKAKAPKTTNGNPPETTEQPTHLTIPTFVKLSALAAQFGLPKRDVATLLLSHAVRELPTTVVEKLLKGAKAKKQK